MDQVQVWGIYEFSKQVKIMDGNPFTDMKFSAVVRCGGAGQLVEGFYDGDGVYRFRYMPQGEGVHTFVTKSNCRELDGITGSFETTAATGVHGPVKACGTRFRQADGTPFFVMGTTAYAWHYRPAEVRAQTLDSFLRYGFNKIRMLVFPKQYSGSNGSIDISYEPLCYPFEGKPCAFDFRRPNPQYFRDFESRVMDLMERGIEADVILFHPYDFGHWCIDSGMDEDDALVYLKYIIARLAAYRNVWWSLANEYDIDTRDGFAIGPGRRNWDAIGEFIRARDPYGHPISCHNISFGQIYPDRPWMTHISYQHPDTYTLMLELMERYHKPVIDDEYQYEGNASDDWGNSSAELTVERHWKSLMAGGYATHGEVFIHENNRDVFWSYGGKLTGESPSRLKYLKEIALGCPLEEMKRDPVNTDGSHYFTLAKGHDFYLSVFLSDMPGKVLWYGPWNQARPEVSYRATVYDVWNCRTIVELEVGADHRFEIKAFTAVKLERMS